MTDKNKLGTLGYQARFYRELRAANQLYSPVSDMAAAPFPRLVQLQTINACNAACIMCPYPIFKDAFPRGRMDDQLFDKLITEIAGRGEVNVFVPMLQNEPMLDKQLFERIGRFKAMTNGRIKVELVTNGALLTEENVVRIAASGLDLLDISLDAVGRDTFERVRVGLRYDVVMAGVERVIAAKIPGLDIFVRLVKVRDNVHEVKSFARHWRKRGIPVFVYTANNRVGALPEYDEKIRVPARQLPMGHRLGRRLARAWLGHCPAPFAAAAVLHNGDVLLCTHDWARKEVLGNLRTHTLAEVWNGDRMREIRHLISERRYAQLPACRDCSLVTDGWV